jgi:hypothetical protein
MLFQESFKRIGLTKLEKEEIKNYLQKFLKNPWLGIAGESTDSCIDAIPDNDAQCQQRFNFTKEQCDAKYNCFTDCIHITMFTVRKMK